MGDSLECRGSAREVVNLLPAETKTVFLGFEVPWSCSCCFIFCSSQHKEIMLNVVMVVDDD